MQITAGGTPATSSGGVARATATTSAPLMGESDRAQAARSAATLSRLTDDDRAFLAAATGEVVVDGDIGASAMAMDIAYARENGTLTGVLSRSFFDEALRGAEAASADQSRETGPGASGAADASRAARDSYQRWWAAAQQYVAPSSTSVPERGDGPLSVEL